MSIPLLTPFDTALWDDELIADLESRDVLSCDICTREACAVVTIRCGCQQERYCARHYRKWERRIRRFMRNADLLICGVCQQVWAFPTLEDVFKVVIL